MIVNLMRKLWKEKVQIPVLLTSRQNTEMLNAFNNNRRSKKDMNEIRKSATASRDIEPILVLSGVIIRELVRGSWV